MNGNDSVSIPDSGFGTNRFQSSRFVSTILLMPYFHFEASLSVRPRKADSDSNRLKESIVSLFRSFSMDKFVPVT